jgi:hypothetical protein
MKKILPLFSYLFHPLFISVYAVLLFFVFAEGFFEYIEFYVIIIQIVLLTILIPITVYYFLLSIGKVDSLMMANRAQRKIPLFIHAILLFLLVKKSITLENYPELYYFFLGSLISTVLALIFVYAGYKASLHMIGSTALVVFSMAISLHFQIRMVYFIVLLLVCNGLVATSRLEMKAHTNKELLLGAFIGVLPQAAMLYFWL